MSNRQVLVKAFNRLFLEFLNDLLDVFPENQDIRQAKQYIDLLKGMNPSLFVNVWYAYYSKYRSEIDEGDIFESALDKDYSGDLEGIDGGNDILDVFERLKPCVREMNETNRAVSIDYVRKMSRLSQLYQALL